MNDAYTENYFDRNEREVDEAQRDARFRQWTTCRRLRRRLTQMTTIPHWQVIYERRSIRTCTRA